MFHRSFGLSLTVLLGVLLCVSSCGRRDDAISTAKPIPPADLKVAQEPDGLHLSWKPVPGASHYTVFWGSESGQYRGLADAAGLAAIITSPSKGTLYAFAVTSWNARGESTYSREVLFVSNDDEGTAPKYLSRGKELMSAGRLDEAQAYLSAAIRMHPGNAEIYQVRASLFDRMQQFDLAKSDRASAEKLSTHKTASLEVRTR